MNLLGFSVVLETILAFTVASVASEFLKFQQRGYGLYKKSRVGGGKFISTVSFCAYLFI